MNAAKTLTVRLPLSIYEMATHLAEARGQSLNRLFQEGLQLLESHDRQQRLFDDFTTIADTADDEADVTFAFTAQAETLKEP